MPDEIALLRKFAEERSDAAFRALVEQRLNFVYSAALRQVGGDGHLAEEVAQTVFVDLARKARSLTGRTSLGGWLYTCTRFAAAKALRSRFRRLNHETEAHMQELTTSSSAADLGWRELRPVVDEAMHELGERDREVILLRFFEGRTFREVGAALGMGENAARMRVERGLEKLRRRLARRGITSTASLVGMALASQTVVAAPAGVAASIAGTALGGLAAAGAGAGVAAGFGLNFMGTTKLVLGAAGVIAVAGLGAYLGMRYEESRPAARPAVSVHSARLAELQAENDQLRSQLAQRRAERAEENAASPTAAGERNDERRANPLESLRMLTELHKRRLADPKVTFLGRDRKLTPAFAELFALTRSEQDALQGAIDDAEEKLAALERAHAAITRDSAGKVVITLRAFPEAGGAVYDRLLHAFAETLGPERQGAFLSLGAEQIERALGRFGAAQRTITVAHVGDASGARYSVREEHTLPSESGNTQGTVKGADQLAMRLGTVARLLPPEWAGKR